VLGNRLLLCKYSHSNAKILQDHPDLWRSHAHSLILYDDVDTAAGDVEPSPYKMRVVERDGSVSNFCGNACLALSYMYANNFSRRRLAIRSSIDTDDHRSLGPEFVYAGAEDVPQRDDFDRKVLCLFAKLPVRAAQQFGGPPISFLLDSRVTSWRVADEPHVIVEVAKTDARSVREIVRDNVRDIDNFVRRTNVNVTLLKRFNRTDRTRPALLEVMTYERGVGGITGSCGTASAACAAHCITGSALDGSAGNQWLIRHASGHANLVTTAKQGAQSTRQALHNGQCAYVILRALPEDVSVHKTTFLL